MPSMEFASPYDPSIVKPLRLRGQVHCHWFDDFSTIPGLKNKVKPLGKFSIQPSELEHRYHDAGYDFIIVTEHNSLKRSFGKPEDKWQEEVPQPVPPTGEELKPPVFVHVINGEEITPGEKHVLALGIDRGIPPGEADDSKAIYDIAQLATDRGGVAFMPHPGVSIPTGFLSLLRGKDSLLRNIVLPGSRRTNLSGFAIRNGANALQWLAEWDRMLRRGVYTLTPDKNKILLPAFAEDDYAPIGFSKKIGFANPGSTWIELEIDDKDRLWSEPLTQEGNRKRSEAIVNALRYGRWWSYWVNPSIQWSREWPYPKLSLSTNPAEGSITVWSTVRDLVLQELKFIGAQGVTHPLKTAGNLRANERITYHCQPADKYVRVMASYDYIGVDPTNPLLHMASNAIWINPNKG